MGDGRVCREQVRASRGVLAALTLRAALRALLRFAAFLQRMAAL